MVTPVKKGAFAAIGNFDGVHRGHQYLLEKTQKLAEAAGAPMGVVVFNPHPRCYFRPQDPPFLLTTSAERDRLLRSHGVDVIMTLTFDAVMAALTPEAFVRDILRDQLGLSGVATGAEFRFGKGRAGDAAILGAICEKEGIVAHKVTPMTSLQGEEKIGSSAVRYALKEGDMKRAALLLGRPWSVSGSVCEGRKLGRAIGFPTANITLGELIEPKYGVYVITVKFSGKTYNGVANFGRRPTVGADAPLLEVHIFDFDGDLYGASIDVAFMDFIRPEKKFNDITLLKTQIAEDSKKARAYFEI